MSFPIQYEVIIKLGIDKVYEIQFYCESTLAPSHLMIQQKSTTFLHTFLKMLALDNYFKLEIKPSIILINK